jgi:signal transduction histidine kinase
VDDGRAEPVPFDVTRETSPIRLPRRARTIRGALAIGFTVVFGLWLLSGYQLIRDLQQVEDRIAEMQESFVRGERARSTVRQNVLLGSIYLRDALIDAAPGSREFYRERVRQIRTQIEQLLPEHLRAVELPIERSLWSDLQAKLDSYFDSLELVFAPNLPSNTFGGTSLLRKQVVPSRDEVLDVVDNLRELQQLSQDRHRLEASVMYADVRKRFINVVSVAIVLGIVVATFAYRRVGTLEHEIQTQREAERRNQEDLERLSARLVDAQEQERRSLARELHDEVGQALTAIKMSVGVALRSPERDDRAKAALDDARGIAENTLHAVRDLSQLLHPSMLDDFGLPETLRAYLRGFSERSGIRTHLTIDGLSGRLPADAEVCVYRIVQEALTNVARHSGAATCTVSLTREADRLRLTIEDDGRGIKQAEPGQKPASRGLGLIGMRERAQALAGRFVIENRREGGTWVRVTLPVSDTTDYGADRLAG